MGESSSSDSDEEFRSTALDLDFGAESEMSEESVSEPSENIWSRVRRECERRWEGKLVFFDEASKNFSGPSKKMPNFKKIPNDLPSFSAHRLSPS